MRRFAAPFLAAFCLLWLFVGIEADNREHATGYRLFLKQEPSLQVVFTNPIACGECDVEIFEEMPVERTEDARRYCAVRFGLGNLRMCHAIFAEEQRQAQAPLQSNAAVAAVAARFVNQQNVERNGNWAAPSVNDKVIVPECMLPLVASWRNDADGQPRINVHCAGTGRTAPADRWDISLPVR
ncbi:MAG TPA: hypothetical protein VD840_08215 [Sinorhizobium sp.]|nr:hypothetical protein [Sinorhizobium sp.]